MSFRSRKSRVRLNELSSEKSIQEGSNAADRVQLSTKLTVTRQRPMAKFTSAQPLLLSRLIRGMTAS